MENGGEQFGGLQKRQINSERGNSGLEATQHSDLNRNSYSTTRNDKENPAGLGENDVSVSLYLTH